MKVMKIKTYYALMFCVWSIIGVLFVLKAFKHSSEQEVYPKTKEVIKSVYIDPKDLSKMNLSLGQYNYYERIYGSN